MVLCVVVCVMFFKCDIMVLCFVLFWDFIYILYSVEWVICCMLMVYLWVLLVGKGVFVNYK